MASQTQIEKIIDIALEEDVGRGDVTTKLLIPDNLAGRATIIARERILLAGSEVARIVFIKADQSTKVEIIAQDGSWVNPGDVIMTVESRVSLILKAERIALNFLAHLSGIATFTSQFVDKVKKYDVDIMDTRKTLPGMRMLEKYAVYAAGGKTKRPDLATGILIKDNHLTALQYKGISLVDAIKTAKENKYGMKVEIEVNTLDQLAEAVKAGPAVIMLDNMTPDEMKKAVEMVGGKIRLEASGGVNLENIEQIAASGVDAISIGAITHSAPASDFSLIFPLVEAEEPKEVENQPEEAA